jgi:hypothetical protein
VLRPEKGDKIDVRRAMQQVDVGDEVLVYTRRVRNEATRRPSRAANPSRSRTSRPFRTLALFPIVDEPDSGDDTADAQPVRKTVRSSNEKRWGMKERRLHANGGRFKISSYNSDYKARTYIHAY